MKKHNAIQGLYKVINETDAFSSLQLKPRYFPKGKILTEEGNISPSLYLIQKGVMRAYYMREHSDITAWMVADGNIACISESFFSQRPSSLSLETLENTWALTISFEQYCLIRDYNRVTTSLVVALLEEYLIHSQQRIELFRYHSVDERIAHYLQQPDSLFRRIPDRYIATFLGTTEPTFSKCLRRVFQNKR